MNRITPKAFQHTARVRSFLEPNMKQIDGAVQTLESDIGFWRPSVILLKKLKNAKKIHQANSDFEFCVWRAVLSHHPQEVFLAQFSLHVQKGGLKFNLFSTGTVFQIFCILKTLKADSWPFLI